MGSIVYDKTRSNGLKLLGDGCKECKYRNKCRMETCNITTHIKYNGMSDLGSDYMYFTQHCKRETYIRETKGLYFIISNGRVYSSGEVDNNWYIYIYFKGGSLDRKSAQNSIMFTDENIKIKKGKRYVYLKGLKRQYEIPDNIPLENGTIMIY